MKTMLHIEILLLLLLDVQSQRLKSTDSGKVVDVPESKDHPIPVINDNFYTVDASGRKDHAIHSLETKRTQKVSEEGQRLRSKRQSYPDHVDELTAAEEQEFEDKHNELRGKQTAPTASNMQYMHYNQTLAHWATLYAADCKWYHDRADGDPNGSADDSQNLYASSVEPSPGGVVGLWHSEESNYNYVDITCPSGICGHFTQVVWATSNQVGCGKAFCETAYLESGSVAFSNTWIVNCHYYPPGNINVDSMRPYIGGPPCTGCTIEPYTHCYNDQLCNCKLFCDHCGQRNDYDCSCDCLDYTYWGPQCISELCEVAAPGISFEEGGMDMA
ncbi:serotriflin-like [Amphiura filiformis]|uniref:serotriflin-like n=1 Tax=Amphiura filiformis TaxID=82378 RepID=UPI003B21C889